MTWYDGGLMPPTPPKCPPGKRLPDNGVLYVGSKGKMYHGSHGGMPQLLPAVAARSGARSPQDDDALARPLRGMAASLQGRPAAGVELRLRRPADRDVLLGVLSLRAPGTRLEWDAAQQKVKNAPELNQFIHTEYRKGWTL